MTRPDPVTTDAAQTLTEFVDHMDVAMMSAASVSVKVIEAKVEVAKAKGLFVAGHDLDDKALDMLMIRVRCAEEFKRVATEHLELLRLRREANMGVDG